MTFATPWLLLGLVLIPLLAVAYGAGERRRRRAAAGFAAPATRASVAPRAPGVAPSRAAAARRARDGRARGGARAPAGERRGPGRAGVDRARDGPLGLDAGDRRGAVAARRRARRPARRSSRACPAKVRVGGIVFDHRTEVVQDPTTDRAALRTALRDAMVASGGTATGDALDASLAMLDAQRGAGGEAAAGRDRAPVGRRRPRAGATRSRSPSEAAARGVPVYTVALGTPDGTMPDGQRVPPDTASLQAIAERSGGAGVHRVGRRRAQRGVRAARVAGGDAGGAARDHRCVRGRRDAAAARGRRALAALVPPADLRRA